MVIDQIGIIIDDFVFYRWHFLLINQIFCNSSGGHFFRLDIYGGRKEVNAFGGCIYLRMFNNYALWDWEIKCYEVLVLELPPIT